MSLAGVQFNSEIKQTTKCSKHEPCRDSHHVKPRQQADKSHCRQLSYLLGRSRICRTGFVFVRRLSVNFLFLVESGELMALRCRNGTSYEVPSIAR
ncbi:hypothetical protein ElyMa_006649700, partial [Elysia marginata]